MKRVLATVLGFAAFLPGCGNGSNGVVPPPPQVVVTISPTSASIKTGETLQFKAMVTNTTNTAVTWKVNNTTGGSAASGTISSSGLYTAPATVPNPAGVTVTAVSQADTTASASAAVTITPGAQGSISPSAATVLAAATQQFTTTLSGGVAWQVNGVTGGASSTGTISASGLYTAPAIPPPGQVVTVTVSQTNPAESASATVTVAPSLATLKGQYTFSFSGQNSLGTLIEAGSFQADGKGGLSSGIEDVNSGAGIFTNVSFTGTYTVGKDGRCSLLITPDPSTGLNSMTFDAVLASNSHARLIRFDTQVTGTGNLDLQNSAAFANSALKGNYVLNLDGIDSAASPLSAIARVSLDGAGTVTAGQMDANDNGTVTQGSALTGTYNVGSNGRGTMTLAGSLGTFDFTFYVISSSGTRLMAVGGPAVWAGTAAAQQGSNFNKASLHGPFVFAASGVNANGALDDAGQFVSTAAGTFANGVSDENNNGTLATGVAFTGAYTVNSDGYGTLSLTNTIPPGSAIPQKIENFSFYLVSESRAILLGTDSFAVNSGSMLAQSQTAFTAANLKGPYGFTVDGVFNGGPLDKLGQFTADGVAAATGAEDVNGAGSLNPNLALTATYTMNPNGRGTLMVTAGGSTRVLNCYLSSPDEIFLMGLDADQVVLGLAERQFK